MAQYKTGTVSVTNGSATVTGSGTLWSGEIAAGDLFTIVGDNAWYEVASVGSNTSITLSANYAGTTGSGKSYAISRDFTTRLALPYPQKGDIETASIIKRAFEQIDTETNIATANYSATSAPTANDDSGDGYSIGSWWVNVTSDEAYLCVDATVGAAVWTKISVDVPSEIVALLAGQSVSMASLTLSGGTANGVLYLNGSKVATSGSALTFDGSGKLALGNVAHTSFIPTTSLTLGNSAANAEIRIGQQDTSALITKWVYNATVGNAYAAVETYGQANYIQFGASDFRWQVASSEAMRLTSTGLGIGTSSVGYKLQVSSGATAAATYIASTATPSYSATSYNGANALLSLVSGGASGAYAGIRMSQGGASEALFGLLQESGGAGAFVWQGYNGSSYVERMRLDSSGNLGLGVTPSAWSASWKGFQIAAGSDGLGVVAIASNNVYLNLATNAYYDTSWKYKNDGKATDYSQNNGQHEWYIAGSGTAGAAITFTQAMTLASGGQLGIGNTIPGTMDGNNGSGTLVVGSGSGSQGMTIYSGSSSGNEARLTFANSSSGSGAYAAQITYKSGDNAILFYNGNAERARIDSSGNLLVGTTSNYVGETNYVESKSGYVFAANNTGSASNRNWVASVNGYAAGAWELTSSSANNNWPNDAYRFAVTIAGSCFNTTGTYGTLSDIRFKENIADARNYLSDLMQVRVVKYSLKEEQSDKATKIGVIAQEVEQIFPGIIDIGFDPEGNEFKSVKMSVFVPMLIKSIQELKAEFDAYKASHP